MKPTYDKVLKIIQQRNFGKTESAFFNEIFG